MQLTDQALDPSREHAQAAGPGRASDHMRQRHVRSLSGVRQVGREAQRRNGRRPGFGEVAGIGRLTFNRALVRDSMHAASVLASGSPTPAPGSQAMPRGRREINGSRDDVRPSVREDQPVRGLGIEP